MSTSANALFKSQLEKAELHSVTSWHRELEIAKALKMAHDDENKHDEAIALEKLGDVYNARALLEDNSDTPFVRLDQFVLATALYNSSLIRSNDSTKKNELEAKLRRIEENILSHCGQAINASEFRHDIDRNRKSKLEEFREQCSEKLKSVQSKYSVFTSPLHDRDAESEARRAKAIREIFTEIREFMKDAVALLLDECIQVLGQPPQDVNYAFIGFGSFARREATPFSDLESALLIEDGKNDASVKEYFMKLMEYFNYKVLNLQETILPSMCIPSLNDANNLTNSLQRYACSSQECGGDATEWPFLGKGFYDDEMCGFSVDGRMSKACKTPLGRLVLGRGENKDLIKTPTELAELYVSALKFDGSRVENNCDLSTVLSNVSFLYGNDPELVDTYDALVLSMTGISQDASNFNLRQSSAIVCLQNALDQFQFSFTSRDIGLISSIKKKLYRAVGMLITNIGKFQYSSVIDNSPWSILDRLLEDGIISADTHRNLFVVVSIVNEVRLMAYLRCGRQDEIFSFFDQSTDIDFELVRDLCVRFFYTVFPFQKSVKKILLKLQAHESATIQFVSSETFYEYSHFNSAVALSFTSYRNVEVMIDKFKQTYESAKDEDLKRLCLAYLSCIQPDYTAQYCEKILTSMGDGNNSEWKILTYLIAAMASLNQDNVTNIETFLNAAREASESDTVTPNSTMELTVRAYNMLISGFLKFRQESYNEALHEFNYARMLYERVMKSKESVVSLFECGALFMSGSCHMMQGEYKDPNVELAMRNMRHYTGNGDYMRILYHAYMLCQEGAENQEGLIKHMEKLLELFLRFRCPTGQELWASIMAQGIILAALFLGLLYRNTERVDDALRIFRLASSHLITKALELCGDKCHVGKIKAEKARMFIDAFRAIFKFSEAECLHLKDCKDEMWVCIDDALGKLANYRGKFERIEERDVFTDVVSRGGFQLRASGFFSVYSSNENRQYAAPHFADAVTMPLLLEGWCDTLTRGMQFILYTTERDVAEQILHHGTPIISMMFPNLLPLFQANPCNVLRPWVPIIRPVVEEMISEIFSSVNSQRTAVLEQVETNVATCQQYAVEFLSLWKNLFFFALRFSLCNDLLDSFGFLKE
ncbi:tetratricopeptide repeat 28-like [Paramuricea clavata]|uniref:Tetratricopeptide repeat 28-like n=1 Tax=Paramuricea clavata TaxID=317549 RepID=A0A6S7GCN4_PARCT|nr:tetratricopeptide repeat 28-like [Paramuricea clavata]